MKTFILRSGRKNSVNILLIFLFILISAGVFAQKEKEISLSLYPGYTLVNFEEALGYPDDYMEDWSEIHISAALRGFLLSGKPFHFGAEIAWQQLYYAYYVVPYEPSSVYREFNVSTISLMALGRYSGDHFFAVAGAGAHFFSDGVAPSVCVEAGYKINIGTRLAIPLSFRINPVFGDGTPILFSLGAGLSLTLK